MALSIKNEEADRLARQISDLTGESLTAAVVNALRERLRQVVGRRADWGLKDEIGAIQARIASLPLLDPRSDEEILGYDPAGAPA